MKAGNLLATAYMLIMFVLYPFYMKNGYEDLGEAKYHFFFYVTTAAVILLLVLVLSTMALGLIAHVPVLALLLGIGGTLALIIGFAVLG